MKKSRQEHFMKHEMLFCYGSMEKFKLMKIFCHVGSPAYIL